MIKKVSRHDTFTPGDVINDPERFAGRVYDIERALSTLRRKGCSLMVYGERGVGKSSFANMIKKIALGDTYLIEKHGLQDMYNENKCVYRVAEISCDENTKSVEDVLQRLITSPNGLRKEFKYKIEYIESTSKDKIGLNFNPFNFVSDDKSVFKISYYNEQSIFEIFTNIILFIRDEILKDGEGLLIHIDEFDVVKDKSSLASIIKSLSTDMIKFMVSGIANDYNELLSGHRSISRQLFQGRIKIEPMVKEEMELVFNIATQRNENMVIFHQEFKDAVFDLSEGFPYFIQLCGQLSLDAYLKETTLTHGVVMKGHLDDGLKNLVKYEPQLDELYYSVIGDKKDREICLKVIANKFQKMVKRNDIYRECEKQGVDEARRTLTYLLSFRDKKHIADSEQVLEPIGDDYISFSSTLFKLYVRTRENIF